MPTLPCRGGDIAIELHCVHINLRLNGAGEGNRTLVACLGSTSSTIELHPPCPLRDGRTGPRRGDSASSPFGCLGTDLSRDRLPCGSQHAFASGRSLHPLSDPLQTGLCFLHDPLPSAASDDLAAVFVCQIGQTPHGAYPVPRTEHESVGFRLFAGDRLSAYPHQAREYPITCRFGQSPMLQVTFGSSRLDDVYSGSQMLTL